MNTTLPADILAKKIAKLEQEAAFLMAYETFLDCDANKVKVGRTCKPRPSEKVINRWSAQ